MKALTICQPYATLIARGIKRVENRKWSTNYRGPLLIHAGKSRDWLDLSADGLRDESYDIPLSEMPFGAVVAKAELIACLPIERIRNGPLFRDLEWVRDHVHAEGPWCWVLNRVEPIGPYPCNGAQGLWNCNPGQLRPAPPKFEPIEKAVPTLF